MEQSLIAEIDARMAPIFRAADAYIHVVNDASDESDDSKNSFNKYPPL
jgi:hypothetical protein